MTPKAKRRLWTEKEENYLIEKYYQVPAKEIAITLNRTEAQITAKAQHLRKKRLLINKKLVIPPPPRHPGFGLRLDTIKLNIGQTYTISNYRDEKTKLPNTFTGIFIQETDRHITLRHELGYCESFLKADLLMGDYKEVKS